MNRVRNRGAGGRGEKGMNEPELKECSPEKEYSAPNRFKKKGGGGKMSEKADLFFTNVNREAGLQPGAAHQGLRVLSCGPWGDCGVFGWVISFFM